MGNEGSQVQGTASERTGVRLPAVEGSRSSSRFGAAVIADSVRSSDAALAEAVLASRAWRKDYMEFLLRSTALAASAKESLLISEHGLASARSRAVVRDDAGDEVALDTWQTGTAAGHRPAGAEVDTVTVQGTGERLDRVEVPFHGELLAGDTLRRQLETWVSGGQMEPGFAAAIERVLAHPEWLSLPGHEAVLLGAGAAMGPLPWLSRWGADITAVDVAVPAVWDRISRTAALGAGRLQSPQAPSAAVPGAHLSADLATLRPWLAERWADGAAPLLGTFVYADGAAHVELTLAADVLAEDLAVRPDAVLAYLNTPTDTFLVPEDVVTQARARMQQREWNGRLTRVAHGASGGRLFAPAYAETYTDETGTPWGVNDTLIDIQGPNYALAKRIQRWRGVLNRHAGRRTSSTVAPASWTHSVTKNKALAAAYHGAGRFGVEIFPAETSAALMAAKLVADVFDETDHTQSHPETLFSGSAVHGGLWRQPFEPRSALTVAAVLGAPKTFLGRS